MRKYRSLIAWQRARAATLHVFRVTNASYHPRATALFDQLRRAVLSIELNIVEGYAFEVDRSSFGIFVSRLALRRKHSAPMKSLRL